LGFREFRGLGIILIGDMFGYLTEELIGQTPRALKSGLHSEDFYKDMWTTILNGDIWFDQISVEKSCVRVALAHFFVRPIIWGSCNTQE
jgi:hypothetical protein